ncbi:hypothetical protein KIN20_018057 [Parelaphostrongylus tenuis]|uniref:Uncharacterized protein n=1 Tax=Parelaphostrongylus tenuis TaxID=148309 RepID=A0AAD5MIW2_PARTN|nr:hypothetical protein KIN20_018057 [Parelaphostrongylus tenuis]
MDLLHKGWFTEFSPDDLEKMKNEESGTVKQMRSDGRDNGRCMARSGFFSKSQRNPVSSTKRISRCPRIQE